MRMHERNNQVLNNNSKFPETMNTRFDLYGNEINRIGKYYLISRIARFGNYGGGPGLKCLLIVFIAHFFGKPLGWILVFFEEQLKLLLNKMRSRKV